MKQAPIDELLKRCSSIYKLAVISAKRAKELSEGAPKLIRTDLKKITSIALEEIYQGRITCKPVEGDAPKGARKIKERAKTAEPVGAAKKKKA